MKIDFQSKLELCVIVGLSIAIILVFVAARTSWNNIPSVPIK